MHRFCVAATLLLSMSPLVSSAQTQPACGSTLTTDTTLIADLSCTGTALHIGADDITVDLNGHTISGDGVTFSTGIRNAGRNNVTIENGTITGFARALHLLGASENTIRAITADGNFFSGIFLEAGANRNRIVDCVVINNGSPARPGNGITINSSNGNVVTRTLAAGNHTQGIFVGGGADTPASFDTQILNNTAHDNVSNGIGFLGGSGHAVTGNVSMNNGAHGISFSSRPVPGIVTNSAITGNTVSGNALFGIEVRDGVGNRVVANRSEGNVLSGIALLNADGNTVAGNRVTDSGNHGLFVRSGSDRNAIRGNEFHANRLRGILVSLDGGLGAPAGNTFSGNHATGNALFDVRDQTIGDGTAGTDSTYRGTRCDTSNPAGICVP